MKNIRNCKKAHTRLLAGLAFLACGLASAPTLAQTASVSFLSEFDDPQYGSVDVVGVSADGSVIVGQITLLPSYDRLPFRWTADTGIVIIEPVSWFNPMGSAYGVSADGTKVAGSFLGSKAFSWTTDTGTFDIPFFPVGSSSSGLAISADGSTIVGGGDSVAGVEAFAWTESGGIVALGNFPGVDQGMAVDVSADGSVIVGASEIVIQSISFTYATKWTAGTNGYNLEFPDFTTIPGVCAVQSSTTMKISADGTTVLGQVHFDGGDWAFYRWKADGTFDFPLVPFLPFAHEFNNAWPLNISDDGSIVAFGRQIWMESTNTLVTLNDIQDALVNDFGIDMQGWDVSAPLSSDTGATTRIEAMSATSQDIVLVIGIPLPPIPGSFLGRYMPVIVHLPYLPAGRKPSNTSCSPTWESSALGDPGISMQPPTKDPNPSVQEEVRALEVFDDGNGPMLYAGGIFQYAGGSFVGNGITRWDGQQWLPVGIGVIGGAQPRVNSLLTWDDGTGPALYAAGSFGIAGSVFASNIARWDGQQWSALGAGSTESYELNGLTAFDDGSGPGLYATRPSITNPAGEDGRVIKWDGSQWSELGTNGIDNCTVGKPLVVFDDGTGPALYATFGSANTSTSLVGCQNQPAYDGAKNSLMKWDGVQWSLVGGGLIGNGVSDMVVWDDGSGPALYIIGSFFQFNGGNPALNGGSVLRWDGTSFSMVGSGVSQYFPSLGYTEGKVVDDGSGPALLVAGSNDLVQWDGQSWSGISPFGCPTDPQGPVTAIAQYDDGLGNGIYLGGDWFEAGPEFTRNIAMLRSCTPAPTGDCNADGGVDMLDYGFFSDCLSGPGGGLGTGCECSDLDGDGDVDLEDFQDFMKGFTG